MKYCLSTRRERGKSLSDYPGGQKLNDDIFQRGRHENLRHEII